MTSDVKYTDRDVRENPNYYHIVEDYLDSYAGEFSFLIDCKMRLANEQDLTVGMIRGVLNCMRVDPRAPQIPAPRRWPEDVVPEVERPNLKMVCTRTDFHEPHSERNMYRCQGIMRNESYSYRRPARVHDEKYLFVTAKSTSSVLVHRLTAVEVEWYPNKYAEGWWREPDVIMHTNCKHPYTLRNGLIIDKETVDWYQEDFQLEYCSRCIYEGRVYNAAQVSNAS